MRWWNVCGKWCVEASLVLFVLKSAPRAMASESRELFLAATRARKTSVVKDEDFRNDFSFED
jgi:hypothetical protein